MRTATEKRPRARIIRLVIDGLSAESLIFVEVRSPAFVLSNRDGLDGRGPMCPALNEAYLMMRILGTMLTLPSARQLIEYIG
jgi:hypothetical protein